MDVSLEPAASAVELEGSGSRAPAFLRKLDWPARVALVVIILAIIAAAFGSLLAPEPPDKVNLSGVLEPIFSGSHLLGTDASGRDIFSRILVGARTSLVGPLIVCALSVLIGSAIGVAMAWRGGLVDAVAAGGLDVLFAFPGLLAAILAVAMFGKGLTAPIVALAIVYLPYVARVVRSAAVRERKLPYVAALTVQGFSAFRITGRHIVPNIAPVIVAQLVVTFSYAMIDLAAINFLGLGIQPPQADWGVMVATGQSAILGGHPEEAFSAAFCIVAVIVSVNILGERLTGRTAEFIS
jgi:peptide/nickel transport system permease protein